MSLGSNCCIAACLKQLNCREPGPLDWTNHIPLQEALQESFSPIDYAYKYIHEDLTDKKQLDKVLKRLSNMKSFNGSFVYLLEDSKELNLLQDIKIDNHLYVIVSCKTNALKNTDKITYLYDTDCIFDANKLNNKNSLKEMTDFLRRHL